MVIKRCDGRKKKCREKQNKFWHLQQLIEFLFVFFGYPAEMLRWNRFVIYNGEINKLTYIRQKTRLVRYLTLLRTARYKCKVRYFFRISKYVRDTYFCAPSMWGGWFSLCSPVQRYLWPPEYNPCELEQLLYRWLPRYFLRN